MVGQPFGSVAKVDDSAVGEASLFDDMAHDAVVPVGVDAKIAGDGEGIFNDLSEHAVAFGGTGDAVDHEVWSRVIQPLTVD